MKTLSVFFHLKITRFNKTVALIIVFVGSNSLQVYGMLPTIEPSEGIFLGRGYDNLSGIPKSTCINYKKTGPTGSTPAVALDKEHFQPIQTKKDMANTFNLSIYAKASVALGVGGVEGSASVDFLRKYK